MVCLVFYRRLPPFLLCCIWCDDPPDVGLPLPFRPPPFATFGRPPVGFSGFSPCEAPDLGGYFDAVFDLTVCGLADFSGSDFFGAAFDFGADSLASVRRLISASSMAEKKRQSPVGSPCKVMFIIRTLTSLVTS